MYDTGLTNQIMPPPVVPPMCTAQQIFLMPPPPPPPMLSSKNGDMFPIYNIYNSIPTGVGHTSIQQQPPAPIPSQAYSTFNDISNIYKMNGDVTGADAKQSSATQSIYNNQTAAAAAVAHFENNLLYLNKVSDLNERIFLTKIKTKNRINSAIIKFLYTKEYKYISTTIRQCQSF